MKKQELIDRILEHEPEMFEAWFKATKELRMWTIEFYDTIVRDITYREFIDSLKPEMLEAGIIDEEGQEAYQEEAVMKYLKIRAVDVYHQQLSEFIENIQNNLDPEKLTVYRSIRILKKDLPIFIENLKNNVFMYGFTGIGRCWTINSKMAKTDYMPLKSEFIGLPVIDVLMTGEILNYNIINAYDTFLANLSVDYCEEEEITLDIGSQIRIKQINGEDIDILVNV